MSRFVGVIREVVLAYAFGAGRAMDQFWVAFTLPNLIREVLGEKVMDSAFLPAFKKLSEESSGARAWRLASSIATTLLVLFLPVLAIGLLFAPQAIAIIAPGFTPIEVEQSVVLTRVMFGFILFIGLAAISGAILQAQERFGLYGLAPGILNLVMVICILTGHQWLGLGAAALGMVIGAAAQYVTQAIGVGPAGNDQIKWRFTPQIRRTDPEFRRVIKLSGPLVAESLATRIVIIVERMIASLLPAGSIAALNYSFRLAQLPFALAALGLSRVVMPILIEQRASYRNDEFLETFRLGIRLLFLLIIPCSVLLITLRYPLIRIIYERGHFTPADTQNVAWALVFQSCGLLGMGAVSMISRVFYAVQETAIPVAVNIFRSVANIVLTYLLAFTFLAHGGIALASSISFSFAGLALYQLLKRRLLKQGTYLSLGHIRWILLGYCLAGCVMAGIVTLGNFWLESVWSGTGIVVDGLRIVILSTVGLAVFIGSCVAIDPGILRQISRRRQTTAVE